MSRSPFNIKGGVTPLKKGEKGSGSGKSKSIKQHAGEVGRKATDTKAQDKSGYQRSGEDFINVHSFTDNTRFSSTLASTLGPSLKSAISGKNKNTKEDSSKKEIIGTDADGNPVFGYDYEHDPDKIIKQVAHVGSWDYDNDGMPTYDQAWDLNLENIQNIYTCKKTKVCFRICKVIKILKIIKS